MQGNKGKIAESIKKAEPLFMGGGEGAVPLGHSQIKGANKLYQ